MSTTQQKDVKKNAKNTPGVPPRTNSAPPVFNNEDVEPFSPSIHFLPTKSQQYYYGGNYNYQYPPPPYSPYYQYGYTSGYAPYSQNFSDFSQGGIQTNQNPLEPRLKKPLQIIDPTTKKEITPTKSVNPSSILFPEMPQQNKAIPIVDPKKTKVFDSPKSEVTEPKSSQTTQENKQIEKLAPQTTPDPKSTTSQSPTTTLLSSKGEQETVKEESIEEIQRELEEGEGLNSSEEDESSENYDESEEFFDMFNYPEGVYNPQTKIGEKKYPRIFLEQFKDLYTERLENMASIEIEIFKQQNNSHHYTKPVYYRDSPGRARGRGRGSNSPGGRDRKKIKAPFPPQPDVIPLIPSQNRWEPTRQKDLKGEEIILRKVKGMLNKITEENFESISDKIMKFLQGSKTNEIILRGVINLIFEKALREKKFSRRYAELCAKLKNCKLESDLDGKNTFRRLLLNKCQEDFEKNFGEGKREEEVDFSHMTKEQILQYEEDAAFEKKKILGNVTFIGELFKIQMLTKLIMLSCIKQFIDHKEKELPHEDNLEALCQLVTPIGKLLEEKLSQREREDFEDVFKKIEQLIQNDRLSIRIRFLMRDVIELRQNSWIPRSELKNMNSPIKEFSSKPPSTPPHIQTPSKESNKTPTRQAQPTTPNEEEGWEVVQKGGKKSQKSTSSPSIKTPTRVIEQNFTPNKFQFEEQNGGGLSEKLEEKIRLIMKEYLLNFDDSEVVKCLKELNISNYPAEVISLILQIGIDNLETNQIPILVKTIYDRQLFSSSEIEKGFSLVIDILEDIILDIPKSPQILADYCFHALIDSVFSLSNFYKMLTNSSSQKNHLFILAVQTLSFLRKHEEFLKNSVFNLYSLMPEKEKSDTNFQELLKKHGLEEYKNQLRG